MSVHSIQNLVRVSDGYAHPTCNIRFRVSSLQRAPLVDALQRWNTLHPMTQDRIAQYDEIWRTHATLLQEARTGLEAYVHFQDIPPCAAADYKDPCGNTVAHRLVLVFRKSHPDLVREFWDFAHEDLAEFLTQKNTCSHTPWELMSMFPHAWGGVLQMHLHELHRLVPIRSWREAEPFRAAYFALPEPKRAAVLSQLAPRQVGLLCMLTTPEGFEHMVRARPEFLDHLHSQQCSAYPAHAAVALTVALDRSNMETIDRLLALQSARAGAAAASPDPA